MKKETEKTISWSFVVFTMAAIVAYIVTGNVLKALIIGTCELFWEPPCYFIHEHVWKRLHSRSTKHLGSETDSPV